MTHSVIPVTVKIMDKEYKISCPEGEHKALLASAQYVSDSMQKIRDSGKIIGTEKVAVMSALNIANELLTSQNLGACDQQTLDKIDNIQASVDAFMKTS